MNRWTSGFATGSLLLAVAIVSAGYGVVLPILPLLLKEAHAAGSTLHVDGHAGVLTGLYSAALVVSAPFWGWRFDRRRSAATVAVCLGGFGASLLLSLLPLTLGLLYGERLLTGGFAGGIVPIVSAMLADQEGTEDERSRRFSWIGIAAISGFLLGPMLSGLFASLPSQFLPYVSARATYTLPFVMMAGLAMINALVIVVSVPRFTTSLPRQRKTSASDENNPLGMRGLRTIGFLVAASVSIFEVGLVLRSSTDSGMAPGRMSLMLIACSLVMLGAQGLVFSSLVETRSTPRLIAPALVIMAVSLLALPQLLGFSALLGIVVVFAASAGILFPIISYWIAATGSARKGSEFGKQAALVNLGQAVGSVVGGMTGFSFFIGPAPMVLASLVLLGAAIAWRHLPQQLAQSP